MSPKLLRRLAAILNLTLAGVVLWQTAALADNPCPATHYCDTSPAGCPMTTTGTISNCCSTLGADCCQYTCQRYSYSGSDTCPPDCIQKILIGELLISTCQSTGICTGFVPP